MIISGTGHRPNKIVFDSSVRPYSDEQFSLLVKLAEYSFQVFQPTKVISGMALGWDMALAQAAINQNLPLVAAVPFAGQEKQWPQSSQTQYHSILSKTSETVIVCEGGYEAWKMQVRNVWLVDHCDLLVALWDGSKGGTGNCIDYAKKKDKPIKNLWPVLQPLFVFESYRKLNELCFARYTELEKLMQEYNNPEFLKESAAIGIDIDILRDLQTQQNVVLEDLLKL